MKTIFDEDKKIMDNIFKLENKKSLKRKYYNQFPSNEKEKSLGMINILLLQNAIFYAKNVLNDINDTCEGDEFIKKSFEIPRF